LAAAELTRWQSSAYWTDLSDEDRVWFTAEVAKLTLDADGTLDGLKKLLNHDYSLNYRLRDLADAVVAKAKERRSERERDRDREREGDAIGENVTVKETTVMVPTVFESADQIESLVTELRKLRTQIGEKTRIHIIWKEID